VRAERESGVRARECESVCALESERAREVRFRRCDERTKFPAF